LSDTALVEGHLNIARVTPASTPGVLDEDVVSSVFVTIADGEDTVVKVGSTSGSDDTTVVHLEGGLIGFDGNGDWALSNGSLELIGGGLNIVEGGDGTNSGALVSVASTTSGGIWVVSLRNERVGFNVLEGVVHKTTIASLINMVAVNELLLRKGSQSTGLDEVGTLNGTGGGERPA